MIFLILSVEQGKTPSILCCLQLKFAKSLNLCTYHSCSSTYCLTEATCTRGGCTGSKPGVWGVRSNSQKQSRSLNGSSISSSLSSLSFCSAFFSIFFTVQLLIINLEHCAGKLVPFFSFYCYTYTTLSHCPYKIPFHRWIWGCSDHQYVSDLDIDWEEVSRVLDESEDNRIKHVGILNFNDYEIHQLELLIPNANHTHLHLGYAAKNVTWEALYPEWIDEEQEEEIPSCPSLPPPQLPKQRLDLIAVKLPCREGNWSRDIARLHLQIAAAKLAASHKGSYPVYLLFLTTCFPIPNLFHCKDLVAREGNAWLYNPDLSELREKLCLPIGSCELALPLGGIGSLV